MVQGGESFFAFVEFNQWEICDPEKIIPLLRDKIESPGKFQPKFSKNLVDYVGFVSSKENKVSYNNPEVDRLLLRINGSTDLFEQKYIYHKLEKEITENCSTIYLCFPHYNVIYNHVIKGITLSPLGEINFADIWIDK